jgi:hypothetical protein
VTCLVTVDIIRILTYNIKNKGMTKRQLQNELSESTTGVKYSKLDEYEQSLVDENIQGMEEMMKKWFKK